MLNLGSKTPDQFGGLGCEHFTNRLLTILEKMEGGRDRG